jgi:hypothetical protein
VDKTNEIFKNYNKEEQQILIDKNIDFIRKRAVDWTNVLGILMDMLKEKVKPLLLVNLEIRIEKDNILSWRGDLICGTVKMIDKLLQLENEYHDMLLEAKKAYKIVDKITKLNIQHTITILRNSEIKYEKPYYVLSKCLDDKDKTHRIELIRENTQSKAIMKLVKKMETQTLYGIQNIDKELDHLTKDFFEEGNEEINAFKNYIESEVKKITNDLNKELEQIISMESLTVLMNGNEDIVFDKLGVAKLKFKNDHPAFKIMIDNDRERYLYHYSRFKN